MLAVRSVFLPVSSQVHEESRAAWIITTRSEVSSEVTARMYEDQDYRIHLLRRSDREDGMVKNETLDHLSQLHDSVIDIIPVRRDPRTVLCRLRSHHCQRR